MEERGEKREGIIHAEDGSTRSRKKERGRKSSKRNLLLLPLVECSGF